MQVIAIVNCGCENDECKNANPNILCLMAEDWEDIQKLKACIEDSEYSVEKLNLSTRLTRSFWVAIETEQRIFQSGKQLLPLLNKRKN